MQILVDGCLNVRIEEDPRLNNAQKRALLRAAHQDPGAEVVATDARRLPVVRARLGGSRQVTDQSVYPSGQMTATEGPIDDEWERAGEEEEAVT